MTYSLFFMFLALMAQNAYLAERTADVARVGTLFLIAATIFMLLGH